jgi:hypothetical protein
MRVAAALQRLKRTTITGMVDWTGCPASSLAGAKVAVIKQSRAARPKPCPGSFTTRTCTVSRPFRAPSRNLIRDGALVLGLRPATYEANPDEEGP